MKIAIISGATSGIGKAIAKELDAIKLDELWLIGRRKDKLYKLKEELETNVRLFPVDLTDPCSITAIKNLLQSKDFEIEYLVNSAGVGYTGALQQNSTEQITGTIDLNCRALTLLTNATLPFIINGGKILNVASGAGFLPQAEFAVYAASKAYVISLSRALKKELRHRKISVCALCPGPVDTEFFGGLENVKEYKKKYLISPKSAAIKGLRDVNKGKSICTPSFSMRLLRLSAKILPTSLLLKFAK